MVRTTRDGKVYTEAGETDVDLGSVEKDDETGQWKGDCALCEHSHFSATKSAAVDELEAHFIATHTAQEV